MEKLQFPIYDGKESITKYFQRVEKFKILVFKDKYSVILKFVNEWLQSDFSSLYSFKNQLEDDLLKNEKHNRDVCRLYSNIFKNKFGTDLTVDLDTDSDEIKDKYIIYLLMKMLQSIEYTLFKREISNKTYYTIIKND
jgi:hypothetical protein